MRPALRSGKMIVATGLFGSVRVNDVVVIRHQGLEKIKRVESISDEGVWVVGDNLAESKDSRHFGPVPQSAIIARILCPWQ